MHVVISVGQKTYDMGLVITSVMLHRILRSTGEEIQRRNCEIEDTKKGTIDGGNTQRKANIMRVFRRDTQA